MEVEPNGVDAAQVEQIVRAYIARVARRYAPLAVGALAVLMVVILVPSTSRTPTQSSFGPSGIQASSGASGGVAGASSAGSAGTAAGGGTASSPAGGPGAVATTGGSGAAAGGASSPGSAGVAAAGSTSGVARSGVHCGPGVKQVPWSAYAPPCVAQFSGNNGGATSHGVTARTITLSYRVGNSAQDAAVYAAAGAAAPAPDADYIADLNTFIGLFNKDFELYGRKVVLKSYQGQGDYILEDEGQDQAQAQADAVTARGLGAFADVTFQLKGSNPYWTGLAQQGVIAMGPLGFPESYYQRYAPYWWSFTPSGTQGADLLGNSICARAAGLPAVYAGDALYQKQTRKFGLITPENPEYLEVANEIKGQLSGCGVTIAKQVSYAIDVTSYESEAASMVAQMKASGVTTVICFCDPIVPIFLSNSASSENYFPEWFEPNYLDPQGRLENQNEWSHALSDGGQYPSQANNEAYRAFKLADPSGSPAELYYDEAYFTLVQLFIGLQAAGPDLTPATFERGMDSLPATPTGMEGAWRFGPGIFNPQATVQIGWWSPTDTSQRDGKAGSWQNCDNGQWLPIDPSGRSQWGPAHTQLSCFGK
ncbi:MAG: type 1 periplasmic-binding domain-containing protein [Acidimicrobiales bacterium]